MVTGALLVVALAVAPIAWAAPIFDLSGGFLCSSWWDYCDDSEESKENTKYPPSGGIAIHNAVVVNVSGNVSTQGNATPGNGTMSNLTMVNGPMSIGGGTTSSTTMLPSPPA